jgi:thioredoxin reductase
VSVDRQRTEALSTTRSSLDRLPAVDVAVIGGGPAGLSAAVWSARYRWRVLLLDSGRPRNAPTVATHGYLGMDGVDPWDLISRARRDLLDYPEVTIVTGAQPKTSRAMTTASMSSSTTDKSCGHCD